MSEPTITRAPPVAQEDSRTSNRQSVDWYAGLAADHGSVSREPSGLAAPREEDEEDAAQVVPAINVHASEPDPLEDVDKSATDQHNVLSDDKAVILCATDLGLRRNWKRAAAGDGKEEWEGNVLLKANVVLQSLIVDFDNQSKGEVVEVSRPHLSSYSMV